MWWCEVRWWCVYGGAYMHTRSAQERQHNARLDGMSDSVIIDDEQYISAREAGALLGLSPRQAMRYGEGDAPRIRSQMDGRRLVYRRDDVLSLADELQARKRRTANAPRRPLAIRGDSMPAGTMLDYLRERDERLREVQEQLNQALLTLGKQSTLLQGTQSLRDELDAVKRERDELQAQLRRRPWWRKLLG